MNQERIIELIEKNIENYSCELIVNLALKNSPKNVTWYDVSNWVEKIYDKYLIAKIYSKIYKEVCLYNIYFDNHASSEEKYEELCNYGDIFHRVCDLELISQEVNRILKENPKL